MSIFAAAFPEIFQIQHHTLLLATKLLAMTLFDTIKQVEGYSQLTLA